MSYTHTYIIMLYAHNLSVVSATLDVEYEVVGCL